MFKNVTVFETQEALKGDGAVLVDVRTKKEWQETGLADAWEVYASTVVTTPDMELNPAFVKDLLANVDTTKKVYFICRSGKRSQIACALAQQNRYTDVYNVDGGMLAWMDADLLLKKA